MAEKIAENNGTANIIRGFSRSFSFFPVTISV
jgi:hypothetical protein